MGLGNSPAVLGSIAHVPGPMSQVSSATQSPRYSLGAPTSPSARGRPTRTSAFPGYDRSVMIYTHVAKGMRAAVRSPLDQLG
jgi:hypothetical protein